MTGDAGGLMSAVPYSKYKQYRKAVKNKKRHAITLSKMIRVKWYNSCRMA